MHELINDAVSKGAKLAAAVTMMVQLFSATTTSTVLLGNMRIYKRRKALVRLSLLFVVNGDEEAISGRQ